MTPLHGNPNAKTINGRIEIDRDGTIKRVLVVETDLELNGVDPAYNDGEVKALIEDLHAAMGDQFDRADLVPLNRS